MTKSLQKKIKAAIVQWLFFKLNWPLLKHIFRVWKKKSFYQQLGKMFDGKLLMGDPGPAMPQEIALATSSMHKEDMVTKSDPDTYFGNAYSTLSIFLAALERAAFNMNRVDTILDFGCGSARLLRHFRCLPGVRLIGADINPYCVEWCAENISGAEFHLNAEKPPLDFLENSSVNLVISYSVFTHIPLTLQKEWLAELFRIIKPGGIFLCTIVGAETAKQSLGTEEQKVLDETGHVTLGPDHKRISLSSWHTGQHDVFQTREEIDKVFGSPFRLLEYVPMAQDLLVLQKLPST